jgi:hypothetical protein
VIRKQRGAGRKKKRKDSRFDLEKNEKRKKNNKQKTLK